jgi:hypothetical protein
MNDRSKSDQPKKKPKAKLSLEAAAAALKSAEAPAMSPVPAGSPAPEISPAPAPKRPLPMPEPPSPAVVPTPQSAGDDVAESMQQSLNAAQQGASAVNVKLIHIAQETLNSGLEHARDLTGARNPMQVFKLQMSYWHDTLETFNSQAQELRTLSSEFVANTSEPIRAHMRRKRTAR